MSSHHQIEPQQTPEYWSVITDMLSQAVTGELIGMLNYTSMVTMNEEPEGMLDAVDHANSERRHAMAFMQAAQDLGLDLIVDLQANYWKCIREVFLKWAGRNDLIGCILIQDFMLEGFAISIYKQIGNAVNGSLGELFTRIARQEESHLEPAITFLQGEMNKSPVDFEAKVKRVHEDAMTVLAEMVAPEDHHGHCQLCSDKCVKEMLPHAGLEICTLRGNALNFYIKSLDRLGLPGDRTLGWVANLPV